MSTGKTGLHYPTVRIPTSVLIVDDFLRWEADGPLECEPQWRRPTDRTLTGFTKLHDKTPEAIREFAAGHGVLNMFRVSPKYQQRTDIKVSDGTIWGFGPGAAAGKGEEPLCLWRYFAKRLHSILRINCALKGRNRNPLPTAGLNEDWAILDPGGVPIEDPRDAQFFLLLTINELLRQGSVGLELGIAKWSQQSTDWKLDITYSGLLGALAYRLLLTVIGESNLYACCGCGNPYVRTKKAPRAGQENFCDDCTDIGQRRASQRWKEKNR
jgi:hypothetical protein